MTVSMNCRRCKELITAVDEDELVAKVEAHALDHGAAHGKHFPLREHILGHLRRDGDGPHRDGDGPPGVTQ